MSKKYKVLDTDGMPISDQYKLIPYLPKNKYQLNIQLKSDRVRYAYVDEPKIAEIFVKNIGAKILKIIKLRDD